MSSHLFVEAKPTGGEEKLYAVEGVPHGLLMLSETQQMLLLVPNVRIDFDDELELRPVHDDKVWESNSTVRYTSPAKQPHSCLAAARRDTPAFRVFFMGMPLPPGALRTRRTPDKFRS